MVYPQPSCHVPIEEPFRGGAVVAVAFAIVAEAPVVILVAFVWWVLR
jgi:hypothetical protein